MRALKQLIRECLNEAVDVDDVIKVAKQITEPSGLIYVPNLVKKLGAGSTKTVLAASRAGKLELRPESGLGRLSDEDAALCPKAFDGTPCSWARVIKEEHDWEADDALIQRSSDNDETDFFEWAIANNLRLYSVGQHGNRKMTRALFDSPSAGEITIAEIRSDVPRKVIILNDDQQGVLKITVDIDHLKKMKFDPGEFEVDNPFWKRA